MKYVLLMLILCCSLVGKAQSYRLKIVDPVICFDYKTNKIIVLEDSTYQLQISLSDKRLEKKPIFIDPQVHFEDLRQRYESVSEPGSSIYFIDNGCGWVLEFRNDSIVRIDQSFHHQNQYGGAFFMYEGRPFIFGGYGLFTTKSLLVGYNPMNSQWFAHSDKRPRVSFLNSLFQKRNDKVSFLCSEDDEPMHKNSSVHAFDFKTKEWIFLGKTLLFDTLNKVFKPYAKNQFLIYNDLIYQVDFFNGSLIEYRMSNDFYRRIHAFNNHIILLSTNTIHDTQINNGMLEVFSESEFNNMFYKRSLPLYIEKNFIHKNVVSRYVVFILVFIVLLLLVLWWLKSRRKKMKLTGEGPTLTVAELLTFWINKKDFTIELSEINDFVNYDSPSPDTLKKRRESLLKQFAMELSKKHNIAEDLIFITKVHPKDKRMKILILNSFLVNRLIKEK